MQESEKEEQKLVPAKDSTSHAYNNNSTTGSGTATGRCEVHNGSE